MSRFLCPLALFAVFALVSPSRAQIELPDYGVGARVHSPENGCHSGEICLAQTGFPEVGVYDLEVYGPMYDGPVYDGLRFSLELPGDWTVLSYEVCGSELTDGNPFQPELGLEITGSDCWDELQGPVLRLTVDCATPGAAVMGPWPDSGYVEKRSCGGAWYGATSFYDPRVNIGSFCGRVEISGPCDACQGTIAAVARPASISVQLAPGTQDIRPVEVRDSRRSCGSLPECSGTGYPGMPCFGVLESSLPWVTASFVGFDGGSRYEYDLLFDATALLPGLYSGRVDMTAVCPFCVASCLEVELEVLDPAGLGEVPAAIAGISIALLSNPVVDHVEYVLVLEDGGEVEIDLVDVGGRRVRTIWNGQLDRGRHPLSVDLGEAGVASGVYFLRARSMGGQALSRLVVAAE